jgi:CHAD domain-containing protein
VDFVPFVDAFEMADEKWIAGLHGDMPIEQAAKLALEKRLGVVRDRLPLAVFQAHTDVEHVHQLRVGTRRATAAMRIFADCLPTRIYDKTRKTLRALRRSAGEARDWDVFVDMAETRHAKAPVKERPGLVFLLGYGQSNRDLAQQQLLQANHDKAERFTACINDVLESLDSAKSSKQTLHQLAATMLTELLRELETAARADLQSYEALHQVRILGKQLRYAMEIFESCFGAELRETYYAAIAEMQDILGLANDSYTACDRLTMLRTHLMNSQPKSWPRYQAGVETLLVFHEKRLPVQRRKFEKWWRRWLKSGAEQAFAELVKS